MSELIKLKFDEVQKILMEHEKSVRTEMANLLRERDSFKSELEKKTAEMEQEIRKLRREKIDVKKELEMNRTKWEEVNQREKEPRVSKDDVDLPDIDENAGIGWSKRGYDYCISMTRGCKLGRIEVIKNNLHKENLERFEQSCFGHLLKINNHHLKCQGQLILHLLLLMDEGASSKGRLVFTFKGSNIEFGLREFSHITGLNYLGTSETATCSSILDDVFECKPSIKLMDIEEAFLKFSHENGGRGRHGSCSSHR